MTERVIVSITKNDLKSGVDPLILIYYEVMKNVLEKDEIDRRVNNNISNSRMIEDINDTNLEIEVNFHYVEFLDHYIPDWLLLLDNLIELNLHRHRDYKRKEFKIFDRKWNRIRNFNLKTLRLNGTFDVKHLDGELIEHFTPSLSELSLPNVRMESVNIPSNIQKLILRNNLIRTIEWPTKELNIEHLDLRNNRIFIKVPGDTKNEYKEYVHTLTEEEDERIQYGNDPSWIFHLFLPASLPYEEGGPVPDLDQRIFGEMKKLEKLDLSRNWMIRYLDIDVYNHLKYLDVAWNSIEELKYTRETTNLEILSISIGRKITKDQVGDVIYKYPRTIVG